MDLETKGVSTGFSQLDALTGGLHPGGLVVLAGRPALGKSALAMNIAFHAAREEAARVLHFSLDTGDGHFERRLLSYVAGLNASKMTHPIRLEGEDWPRIIAAAEVVKGLPLFIENSPEKTVGILEDACREAASTAQPFALVVVDYLQLLREGGEALGRTVGARQEQLAKMGRRLKALAVRHSVPILLLVELDRRVERRADKRPVLDDLAPAGDIAKIADTVMLLYRDEVYAADTPDPGIAEIIVAKGPRDRLGTVRLRFDGPKLAFEDLPKG